MSCMRGEIEKASDLTVKEPHKGLGGICSLECPFLPLQSTLRRVSVPASSSRRSSRVAGASGRVTRVAKGQMMTNLGRARQRRQRIR
jgi:hypothetical protein